MIPAHRLSHDREHESGVTADVFSPEDSIHLHHSIILLCISSATEKSDTWLSLKPHYKQTWFAPVCTRLHLNAVTWEMPYITSFPLLFSKQIRKPTQEQTPEDSHRPHVHCSYKFRNDCVCCKSFSVSCKFMLIWREKYKENGEYFVHIYSNMSNLCNIRGFFLYYFNIMWNISISYTISHINYYFCFVIVLVSVSCFIHSHVSFFQALVLHYSVNTL